LWFRARTDFGRSPALDAGRWPRRAGALKRQARNQNRRNAGGRSDAEDDGGGIKRKRRRREDGGGSALHRNKYEIDGGAWRECRKERQRSRLRRSYERNRYGRVGAGAGAGVSIGIAMRTMAGRQVPRVTGSVLAISLFAEIANAGSGALKLAKNQNRRQPRHNFSGQHLDAFPQCVPVSRIAPVGFGQRSRFIFRLDKTAAAQDGQPGIFRETWIGFEKLAEVEERTAIGPNQTDVPAAAAEPHGIARFRHMVSLYSCDAQ